MLKIARIFTRRGACRAGALTLAALSLAACDSNDFTFSQYPGFTEYFETNPPSTQLPSAEDRALLAKFRPRVYLADGQEGPIRFYEDYIAQGRLLSRGGNVIATFVPPALLNERKEDPGIVFEHIPTDAPTEHVVYGRIDRENVTFPLDAGIRTRRVTFLTYNLTFRTSGIGIGLSGWKSKALDLAGDLDDWHQLDHYTAITVAIDERQIPFAVTFQHHNYLRTHILGIDLPKPADGRIGVDIALRSHELYPHKTGRTVHRAVGFMNRGSIDYLVYGRDKPWRAADDVTDPVREIDYELRFLAPADAYYTFKGFLGEKRLLPGRNGPPGADYNTLPRFKPKGIQMIAFHWRENDDLFRRAFGHAEGPPYKRLAVRFWREWNRIR